MVRGVHHGGACAVLLAVAFVHGLGVGSGAVQLHKFYDRSCPGVHRVVRRVLREAHKADVRIYASLTRLHLHDCFIQGCDGSILLDNSTSIVSEKYAKPNNNSAAACMLDQQGCSRRPLAMYYQATVLAKSISNSHAKIAARLKNRTFSARWPETSSSGRAKFPRALNMRQRAGKNWIPRSVFGAPAPARWTANRCVRISPTTTSPTSPQRAAASAASPQRLTVAAGASPTSP